MKYVINNLKIPVERDSLDEYVKQISQKIKLENTDFQIVKILSKKLDKRDLNQFYYSFSFVIRTSKNIRNNKFVQPHTETFFEIKKTIAKGPDPIIIGFGPAGMFAALELVNAGIIPRIFDRGKKIEERIIDVNNFISTRKLNPNSNIQFGEGGAGSFSDGKLFSRMAKNTRQVNKVLRTLVNFGAPDNIVYAEKPHLGTDVLCKIVKNIRNYLLEKGAEIHFNSLLTDIEIKQNKLCSITINDLTSYQTTHLFVAAGNSCREILELFYSKNVAMKPKPISIGLRIEHPKDLINRLRYGKKYSNYAPIGAATYSFNFTDKKNKAGAYTFCMCPGGEIVNASSEPGHLVVNGMSYSTRSSEHSNSAIVVPCFPKHFAETEPLSGIQFQRDIEKRAFIEGGKNWKAPAQNLTDFMANRKSSQLNNSSFKMGLQSANLHSILPKHISETLLKAFNYWSKDYPMLISDQAILVGVETRTSSPVMILRKKNCESENIENLFVIGEGSGHTGGIVSAAVDAIKAIEQLVLCQV